MLRTLHATPGQSVSAGAPLFDLVALDTVWLRVPLYAGDVETVDRRAPATVFPLGAESGAQERRESDLRTADRRSHDRRNRLFYSLANQARAPIRDSA